MAIAFWINPKAFYCLIFPAIIKKYDYRFRRTYRNLRAIGKDATYVNRFFKIRCQKINIFFTKNYSCHLKKIIVFLKNNAFLSAIYVFYKLKNRIITFL